ncbi:hypothetical protein F3Y22_tig00110467pilonHSYRG00304 [Hibiscus syriacus]|uniref:Uncharacterized protein n=1 Tax=Hibiscus syriacus TaxID=106335 RepID=A0A6A3AGL0_HIBSY|nr:hypothetical protein F3Y22_tig00110467pilonHSYRG00304 [Hibiscus syriacus]
MGGGFYSHHRCSSQTGPKRGPRGGGGEGFWKQQRRRWDVSLGYRYPRVSSGKWWTVGSNQIQRLELKMAAEDDTNPKLGLGFTIVFWMSSSHYELSLEKLIHQMMDSADPSNDGFRNNPSSDEFRNNPSSDEFRQHVDSDNNSSDYEVTFQDDFTDIDSSSNTEKILTSDSDEEINCLASLSLNRESLKTLSPLSSFPHRREAGHRSATVCRRDYHRRPPHPVAGKLSTNIPSVFVGSDEIRWSRLPRWVVAFIATTGVRLRPVRRGGLGESPDYQCGGGGEGFWKQQRRRWDVSLGYRYPRVSSGKWWTVGSNQIQRLELKMAAEDDTNPKLGLGVLEFGLDCLCIVSAIGRSYKLSVGNSISAVGIQAIAAAARKDVRDGCRFLTIFSKNLKCVHSESATIKSEKQGFGDGFHVQENGKKKIVKDGQNTGDLQIPQQSRKIMKSIDFVWDLGNEECEQGCMRDVQRAIGLFVWMVIIGEFNVQ